MKDGLFTNLGSHVFKAEDNKLLPLNPSAQNLSVTDVEYKLVLGLKIIQIDGRTYQVEPFEVESERFIILHDVSYFTQQIEEAQQDTQSYLYAISHDFRAPLRAILMSGMILTEDYGEVLDENAHQELKRQEVAAKKLNSYIDELLKLSRIGTAKFSPKPISLSAIAQEIGNSFQLVQDEQLFIDNDLHAVGDEALVNALIGHLISNAVKFHSGERPLRIEVGLHQGEFFVRDNGIGIRSVDIDRITNVFERVNGNDYPGFGTGLTQAKRIVERHSGKLRIESEVNIGTTVWFQLIAE